MSNSSSLRYWRRISTSYWQHTHHTPAWVMMLLICLRRGHPFPTWPPKKHASLKTRRSDMTYLNLYLLYYHLLVCRTRASSCVLPVLHTTMSPCVCSCTHSLSTCSAQVCLVLRECMRIHECAYMFANVCSVYVHVRLHICMGLSLCLYMRTRNTHPWTDYDG